MTSANSKYTMNTTNAQLAARNAARQKSKGSGKVRYVRTAAGQKRFKKSIGDVIVAGEKMENIKHEQPVYPGWDLIKGKNGVKYDVGRIKGKFVAYVHNSQGGLAITADSHADLLKQLNKRVTTVKQTIKPKYDRLGKEKQFAPDGTPIEKDPEKDSAEGLSKRSSTSSTNGTSKTSSSRTGSSSTSKTAKQREAAAKLKAKETKRKQAAKAKANKAAEKGEYEGSSLTGLRQLTGLALGSRSDSARNRRYSEALMRLLQKQGLVQPATKKATARKDPLAERRGKTSSDALKWEPAEGFTMSQVARSIRYDVAIDRILFQWDEDRRKSKG